MLAMLDNPAALDAQRAEGRCLTRADAAAASHHFDPSERNENPKCHFDRK